jgi:hypothetical protein
LNIGLASWVVVREQSINSRFHVWLSEHMAFMGGCIVLAGVSIENMGLAYSGILGKELFSAPIATKTKAQVQSLGLWKWLGDLVLFGVQLYVAVKLGRDKRDVVTFLGLWLTGLLLLHGLVTRALTWVVHRRQPTLESKEEHVPMQEWPRASAGAFTYSNEQWKVAH